MAEKILIVDDDLDTLRLVGLMLQKQGYEIEAANNGEQGLRKAAEDDPDLILLDVMMPDMDGYEVARRLRLNPKTSNIPILMFTAKSQLDDKVTGFEAGVDDYLTKPTHPTELHAHVRALLARSFKNQTVTIHSDNKAFIVGVISARGGIGVSTVSLNLGSYLQSEMGIETIVAEILSGMGSMGRYLGLENFANLSSLLKKTPESISPAEIAEVVKKHESGLNLLLASEQPREYPFSELLPQYKAIFKHLVGMSRFLIMDLGTSLPRINQTLLPQCDHVIVLAEAVASSVGQTKLLIQDILDLGLEENQISVVLSNRARTDQMLSLHQVEELLGTKVSVTFTPAPELHSLAAKTKTPVVLAQEESIAREQFGKLAEIINVREAAKE